MKFKFQIITLTFILLTTGCSERGLDRTIDFSTNASLGKSLIAIEEEANADEKIILQTRTSQLVMYMLEGLPNATQAAIVGEEAAKANIEKLDRLYKSSMREILITMISEELDSSKRLLPILKQIESGEGVELNEVKVDAIYPDPLPGPVTYFRIRGAFSLTNKLPTTINIHGCRIILTAEDEVLNPEKNKDFRCNLVTIAPGEIAQTTFDNSLSGDSALAVSEKVAKGEPISWNFLPGTSSSIKHRSGNVEGRVHIGDTNIQQTSEKIEFAEKHLATLKK